MTIEELVNRLDDAVTALEHIAEAAELIVDAINDLSGLEDSLPDGAK